jgi:hypothetical protein
MYHLLSIFGSLILMLHASSQTSINCTSRFKAESTTLSLKFHLGPEWQALSRKAWSYERLLNVSSMSAHLQSHSQLLSRPCMPLWPQTQSIS